MNCLVNNKPIRLHWLQHVPFEGLGCIEQWALSRGCSPSVTRFYNRDTLPDAGGVDMLIVMGGPMGVHDEQAYPWLIHEKRFIETCIGRGIPVLGICLGAQLIASVLGAKVYRNTYKEIGWYDVVLTGAALKHPVAEMLPASFTAFHWHGDTFDIPASCIHLARSRACKNQAFLYHGTVLGFQFHLESTPQSVEQLIRNCGDEIQQGGPYVQRIEEIRCAASYYTNMNNLMSAILTYLASKVRTCTS